MDQKLIVPEAKAGPYRVTVYGSISRSGSEMTFRIRTITKGTLSSTDHAQTFRLPDSSALSDFIDEASECLKDNMGKEPGEYDRLGFFARKAAKVASYRLLARIDDGKNPVLTLYSIEGKNELGNYLLLKEYRNSYRFLPLEFANAMKDFIANN